MKVPAAINTRSFSKNSSCLARIHIKVKFETNSTKRTDSFIQKGLPAVIIINDEHNHSLNTAEALKFLPATDCKAKFIEYFNDGMGVTESCKYHKETLQLDDNITEADMANSRINPSYRAVFYWYDEWRLQNLDPRTSNGMAEMGRKCFVPGCTSNYRRCPTYISSFIFPKDIERRKLWIEKINRKDFLPSPTAVVCIKHFSEEFILREHKATRDDGSILIVPREKPKLTDDAYPSIFPDEPKCLRNNSSAKRKNPDARQKELKKKKNLKKRKGKKARVCSKHFDESSFEVPLKHKLLKYSPKNSRYLKPDAVPNLHVPGSSQKGMNGTESRVPRIKKEEEEGVVVGLSIVKVEPQSPTPSEGDPDEASQSRNMNIVETDFLSFEKNETEVDRLRARVKVLEEENKKLLWEVKEVQVATVRKYEKALTSIFTPGQIDKLLGNRVRWTLEDITSAAPIYRLSPSAYKYMRAKKYPFPSTESLKRVIVQEKKTTQEDEEKLDI